MLLLAAIALSAAVAGGPFGTLVIAREVGDRGPANPAPTDIEAEAERVVRSFWNLHPKRLRDVSAPDPTVRACGANPACLAPVVTRDGIDRIVYVIANWNEAPPLVTIAILDVRTRKVVATYFETVQDDPAKLVAKLVERGLLDDGHTHAARLTIDVTPNGAAIELEPAPATPAVDPHDQMIRPGRYTVTLSHSGYEPQRRELELVSSQHERVSATLVEVPTVIDKWWFWTAVGVVVAGGVVGTLAATGTFDSRQGCLGGRDNCVGPTP